MTITGTAGQHTDGIDQGEDDPSGKNGVLTGAAIDEKTGPGLLPAGVLWDMDGTLVDTEPYWIACEYALVAEHGGTWSDEHAHALIGSDLLVSARYIARHGPVPLPPEEIVERLLDGVIRRVQEHIPWCPGAAALLAALGERGVPCALVTMSYRRLAEAVVEALPPGSFATLVTGDEVERGKPHPDPYLEAARRLGVEPASCVAIEDSRTGVASAEAAGVPVIAVPGPQPVDPAPRRWLCDSLEGLSPEDLGRWARTVRDARRVAPERRDLSPDQTSPGLARDR